MTPGLAMVVVGTAVNGLVTVRKGHNIFPVLLGGGTLALFVSGLDAFTDGTAGSAVGGTYLLGSLIYHGTDLFNTVNSLLGG